jgi:hypothetical protein
VDAVAVTSGADEVASAVLPAVSRLRKDVSSTFLLHDIGFHEAHKASNLWTGLPISPPTLSI